VEQLACDIPHGYIHVIGSISIAGCGRFGLPLFCARKSPTESDFALERLLWGYVVRSSPDPLVVDMIADMLELQCVALSACVVVFKLLERSRCLLRVAGCG
jgi:hypothetical protein